MTVNRYGYLPTNIAEVVPIWTRQGVELHSRYDDGSTTILMTTPEEAERLYDRLRCFVQGTHSGATPAL